MAHVFLSGNVSHSVLRHGFKFNFYLVRRIRVLLTFILLLFLLIHLDLPKFSDRSSTGRDLSRNWDGGEDEKKLREEVKLVIQRKWIQKNVGKYYIIDGWIWRNKGISKD